MNSTKIVAGIAYVASWCVCILPNSPIHGQAYDEPSGDKIVKQILQKPSEDVADTTCDGYTHAEPKSIKIEDLSSYRDDELINPDDYDSGDYGDY